MHITLYKSDFTGEGWNTLLTQLNADTKENLEAEEIEIAVAHFKVQ